MGRPQPWRSLQEALLPPVTAHLPGIQVGAVYRAGGQVAEVLGDFYDIFETADGRWNAVIGDVCGRGIAAARLTGLARHTMRAAAMRERRPSRVLAFLNEALLLETGTDGRFVAALMVALQDEDTGFRATVSAAGHPPAILRDGEGSRPVKASGTLGVFPGSAATAAARMTSPSWRCGSWRPRTPRTDRRTHLRRR